MKFYYLPLSFLAITFAYQSNAQNHNDKGVYTTPPRNLFYEKIVASNDSFAKKPKDPRKTLQMDFTGVEIPKFSDFKLIESEQPVSQGNTGTCWSFSTNSFFSSEIYRLHKEQINLSPLFTAYWQYVEKAKEYVRTRGNSVFAEGSETNAVQEMMNKYGAVPVNVYSGLQAGEAFQDHRAMVNEMNTYLASVKSNNAWNETEVLATIKSIMNHYMGEPPTQFNWAGKTYTPQEFLKNVAKLNPNDYVTFMSLKTFPYWTLGEYVADDNWWHSKDYHNVPLNDFVNVVKNAVKNGYSVSIGGDVSEGGINTELGAMMIPSFDIPSSFIDDNARLYRFINGSTTDDHAMHIVGYAEKSNGFWFLVKDSGSGGHNNKEKEGYRYMHEDYLKLKMMTATVHKNAVNAELSKFK